MTEHNRLGDHVPDERIDLYTPSEVSALFRVDSKTVARWAKAGKLKYIRTPGGHRRYDAAHINRLLEEKS